MNRGVSSNWEVVDFSGTSSWFALILIKRNLEAQSRLRWDVLVMDAVMEWWTPGVFAWKCRENAADKRSRWWLDETAVEFLKVNEVQILQTDGSCRWRKVCCHEEAPPSIVIASYGDILTCGMEPWYPPTVHPCACSPLDVV